MNRIAQPAVPHTIRVKRPVRYWFEALGCLSLLAALLLPVTGFRELPGLSGGLLVVSLVWFALFAGLGTSFLFIAGRKIVLFSDRLVVDVLPFRGPRILQFRDLVRTDRIQHHRDSDVLRIYSADEPEPLTLPSLYSPGDFDAIEHAIAASRPEDPTARRQVKQRMKAVQNPPVGT